MDKKLIKEAILIRLAQHNVKAEDLNRLMEKDALLDSALSTAVDLGKLGWYASVFGIPLAGAGLGTLGGAGAYLITHPDIAKRKAYEKRRKAIDSEIKEHL